MLDRIGLGLAALGRPAYINLGRQGALPEVRTVPAMRAASWKVLDEAYAAGVRWVDAARSYGRAEEFLAGWLTDRGHEDVVVSSKWGYAYVADWRPDAEVHEVKQHSLDRFEQQWAQSEELLGDRLAVYQVHSLTLDSPLFNDPLLLESLAGLIEQGVRVGFSTSGPQQADTIRRAMALRVQGRPLFSVVQSTWNLLDPSAGPALAEAYEAGAHVLVKEALANGRLAVDPPADLLAMAEDAGVGCDALALAAALAQPWAGTVLLGAASPAQVRANLAALHVRLPPYERLAALAVPARRYWAERSALAWN
ncbi:aldo/keto reductase [Kutzneria viridogrisea]|uniref:Aldo/keto reductase n=2 Tax=Kutzneria TaxID=43356 RepID=W5W5A3_9PSEU|nr:aldo/keto reductase [Kutzneria albida]AHH96408.1 aldo/keto reductase [Kutzneria albida DSM 43870]MBA8928375.1 aryl-alcohol dehydrogenase-like predicted oxidoreductase [Kutzneria viridogrisea]